MSDLTDKSISSSYSGVIHSDESLASSGLSKLYDGIGNESSLSIGRVGQGASITGTLVVTNISITGSLSASSMSVGSLTVGTTGTGASISGNLSVDGSITSTGVLKAGNVSYPTSLTETSIFSIIYPVGSLYLTVNDVNPSTFFTGTNWQKVSEGRYLAGVGESTDVDGNTSTFVSGNNSGRFKETYNLGMVDHIHGVGTMSSSNNDDGSFITQSWTSNVSYSTRGINGDGGGASATLTPQTLSNGLVTSSPLNPITGLPIGSTDTIDIKPPSFAAYIWQRIG